MGVRLVAEKRLRCSVARLVLPFRARGASMAAYHHNAAGGVVHPAGYLDTYEGYREPLDVRFDSSAVPNMDLDNFKVKFVDGFTKGLSILAILSAFIELAGA